MLFCVGWCIVLDKAKNAANVMLLMLMLLGIYQHWMVKDPFERSGPALVFTFMLIGRLVVWYQVKNKLIFAFNLYRNLFWIGLSFSIL